MKKLLLLKPFYLVRHGETYANIQNLTCGFLDSQLTPVGRMQAQNVAAFICRLSSIKNIYHSALSRARDTARIINSLLNVNIKEDVNLNEHNFGAWEGLGWDAILKKLELNENPPDGETDEDFFKRMKNTLNKILLIHDNNPPLIVGHGGIFYALAKFYGYNIKYVQNCLLYYFEPNVHQEMPWNTWVAQPFIKPSHFVKDTLYYKG